MEKWYDIYPRLALAIQQLQTGSNDPGDDVYMRCSSDGKFLALNPWFRVDEYGKREGSIDPIVLFCSFNDSYLKGVTKLRRLNCMLRLFGLREYEKVDFTGCPTPVTIKMISGRSRAQQQAIWEMFGRIIDGGQPALTERDFSVVNGWYGVSMVSLTIFLFWINPRNFLPLDKYTIAYLRTIGELKSPKNFAEYTSLLKEQDTDLYILMSLKAFQTAGRIDVQHEVSLRQEPPLQDAPAIEQEILAEQSYTGFSNAFKLVGLRFLNDMDDRHLRSLDKNTFYRFYQGYSLTPGADMIYEPEKDFSFFDIEGLKINISAIVGGNGAGKSTLVELLLAGINNLCGDLRQAGVALERVEGLSMEIYYHGDHLYRINIGREGTSVHRFDNDGNKFVSPQRIEQFDFEQFFFSIFINYSLYGFSGRSLNRWLKPVYDKVDGYKMPCVLSPHRITGNIDINREEYLLHQRLLANILEPVNPSMVDNPNLNLRQLAPGKLAVRLIFSFDTAKIQKAKQRFNKQGNVDWSGLLSQVHSFFTIPSNGITLDFLLMSTYADCCNLYLLNKLFDIATKYLDYQQFLVDGALLELDRYLLALSRDKSHVTLKLRQVINQLKFGDRLGLGELTIKPELELEVTHLSGLLTDFLSREGQDEKINIIELLPPSFVRSEIVLDGNGLFSEMSSGEKQRINVLSSLGYQLRNINSLADRDASTVYQHVNVVMDEIELYFHPEMQRTFIRAMLDYVSRLGLGNFLSINFCFVTHSPFILSDIPSDNILTLPYDPDREQLMTFGANIHYLLADQFFLKNGFMGDMANKIISDLSVLLTDDEEVLTEKNKIDALSLISRIGEPLIRDRLLELLDQKMARESAKNKKDYSLASFLREQLQKYGNEKD